MFDSVTKLSRRLIAVFGGALHSEKEYSFISELEKACDLRGYYVLAFSFSGESMTSGENLESELTLVRLASDLPLAGIVMMRESLTSKLLVDALTNLAKRRGIPLFSIEKPSDDSINIIFDYRESFKKIVRHIINDHHCERIAMIAGMRDNVFSDERIDAYKEVLAENGIKFNPKWLFYGDFWDRPTRIAVNEIIASGDIPDAVCCANDAMAVTVTQVFKEAGIRVPKDVIVTGFDGIQSGKLNDPSISTMVPDYAGMVVTILDDIDIFLTGQTPDGDDRRLHYNLAPNTSCGCAHAEINDREMTISEISAGFGDIYWVVESMNRIVSASSGLDSLSKLPEIINREIGMWQQNFHHVGLFAEITGEAMAEPSGGIYRTFYRSENWEFTGMGETYSEHVFMPGLERVIDMEDAKKLLMIRLLHSGAKVYGYLTEGFSNLSNRDVHRCEEFGMFLSTAIGIVLANEKLRLLNQQLMQANREIADISVTDYLTGIYNRRGFFNELKNRISDESAWGKYLTVFSIDMDGLKHINDCYGHEEGDFAIKTMAEAIRSFSSRNGFCSRYGGDEFACALITDAEMTLDADQVRDRLSSVISRNAKASSKEYCITASVGSCSRVIVPDPECMDSQIEGMIKSADEEMYADKQHKQAHFNR